MKPWSFLHVFVICKINIVKVMLSSPIRDRRNILEHRSLTIDTIAFTTSLIFEWNFPTTILCVACDWDSSNGLSEVFLG